MYTKRIQIANYGPIDKIDITFPFNGENPKPVLLVGENGSGKSILLSHIVDGLMFAQGIIYPQNSEVQTGRVYKVWSPYYIKSGSKYHWKQVDFERDLHCGELMLNTEKENFSVNPVDLTDQRMVKLWNSINKGGAASMDGNLYENAQKQTIENLFRNNCILYFPHNRFEEPAWLNEDNLKSKAQYMDLKHLTSHTDRKIINYSPLHDNKNWLFEVLYDSFVFEHTTYQIPKSDKGQEGSPLSIPSLSVCGGYQGVATTMYDTALGIARQIFRAGGNLRFGIGRRQNRKVSLMRGDETLVPNIFQLSSGETALLNLFFSILRDFDLSHATFTNADDVRGIVIVDEIDLHLHSIHQYEVLPNLIKMFPRVQFIVTTHSPLFVLGMEKTLGEDGFVLYKLPQGEQIGSEEFSEFGSAYESFTQTEKFSEDIKRVVENAQKPIVFLEGETDVKYLQKAAELLEKKLILEKIQIKEGGGSGNLGKIWRNVTPKLAEIIPQKIILLYDCDKSNDNANGKVFKRSISLQQNHPLKKGIENLFEKATLEKARGDKVAFIDITGAHTDSERGEKIIVPEEWTVNPKEKTNLCDWLCENGTAEDFKHFQVIFGLLEEILVEDEEVIVSKPQNQSPQPK